MCFLGSLGVSMELADLGVALSVAFSNSLLYCVDCQRGKVGGVCSHISNLSALVKSLGYSHRLRYGEAELAACFLLQG